MRQNHVWKLTYKSITAIVIAPCEVCARSKMIAGNVGPEGTLVWRDSSQSTCERLNLTRPGLVVKFEHIE